jgi:glycosyltransferase involved in cell wall biosynthesis
VVVPRHGTFPEYIEATGGGLLCDPDDPESLAKQLHSLVIDPQRADELGKAGAAAIREKFSARRMAEMHQEFYRKKKGRGDDGRGTSVGT